MHQGSHRSRLVFQVPSRYHTHLSFLLNYLSSEPVTAYCCCLGHYCCLRKLCHHPLPSWTGSAGTYRILACWPFWRRVLSHPMSPHSSCLRRKRESSLGVPVCSLIEEHLGADLSSDVLCSSLKSQGWALSCSYRTTDRTTLVASDADET